MTAGPRLVVFDMDGTLIDSRRAILSAMEAAFAARDLALPAPEDVLSVVGLSLEAAMAALVPGASPAEARALASSYRAAADARAAAHDPADAPLYPGARRALDRLAARGTAMGVATGKARRGLDHALALHGLEGLFATLQTADDHPSKPHPAMLEAALAEAGCDAAEAVMVGDTEFDVAMARAAGLGAVAVAWGYHPRARLQAAGAHVVIDRFDALDAALAAVSGRAA